MTAQPANASLERLISDLTDAALEVVLRAEPKVNSIDVELAVGKQIDARVRQEFRFQRWVVGRSALRILESFLSRLVDSVYRIGLEAHVRLSFLDLELGIWNAFRQVACRANWAA